MTIRYLYPAIVLVFGLCLPAQAQKSVEQLKAEAAAAKGGQQAKLYAELSRRLVQQAAEQFARNESDQGHATVREVVDYANKARGIALDTHSKMKEVEIHLREAQRALENVKRSLMADDRPPFDEAEKKLAGFRQQLLDAMFAPKKPKDQGQR